MPYQFLDNIATADIAIRSWGPDLREVFSAAAEAVLAVMVDNPEAVLPRETSLVSFADDQLDLLFYRFLQELVYLKDAQQLFLRVEHLEVGESPEGFCLKAQLRGERIDPKRHQLGVDVKAVTLHLLSVEQTPQGWQATVVLDI